MAARGSTCVPGQTCLGSKVSIERAFNRVAVNRRIASRGSSSICTASGDKIVTLLDYGRRFKILSIKFDLLCGYWEYK